MTRLRPGPLVFCCKGRKLRRRAAAYVFARPRGRRVEMAAPCARPSVGHGEARLPPHLSRLPDGCCQPQRENRPPNMQAVIRLIEMTMMKIRSAEAQGDRHGAGAQERDGDDAASQAAI